MPLARGDIDALFVRFERVRTQFGGVIDSSLRVRKHARVLGASTREAREKRWVGRYERAVQRQDDALRGIGLDHDAD